MRLSCRGLLLAAFAIGLFLPLRQAASQERRPLLESLLRGVLDEQLRRADRDRAEGQAPAQLQNLNEIGTAFTAFERDVDRLAAALASAARQSSSASRLYNQALQLRTAAGRAAALSRSPNSDAALRSLAANIDRDWRNLEFGLKETFVANRSLQNHIDTINRAEQQISQLFELKPQFSRGDAVRQLEAFSETVGHIVEDLEFELRFSEQRTDLTLTAWRVRQLAKYIVVLLDEEDSGNEEVVVREFRTLDQRWRDLAVRLRDIGDRHLDRDIRRAEESINNVRRLLRLPQQLDRAELDQLVRTLKTSTEGLFKSVTLETLIEMRSPQSLLPEASEFYGLCEHFQLSMSQDFQRAALVEAFRPVETSWRGLSRRLREANDAQTLRAMEDVDRAVTTIRLVLGAPPSDDRYQNQEATSSLTVLSRHLETEIAKRVSNSPQYASSFRRSLDQELDQFTQSAARLNESSVRGISRAQLNTEVQSLAQQWGRVQMLLAKLQPRDRPVVTLISSQVSEQLLKLGAGN